MKVTSILLSVLVLALLMSITSLSRASTVYTESFEGTLAGTLTGSIDQVKVFDDGAYGGQSTDVAHGAPSGPDYHFLAFNANSVGGFNTSDDATGGSFTSSPFLALSGGSYTLSFDYGMFASGAGQSITVTVTDTVTSSLLLTQNIVDTTGATGPHAVTSPYSFTYTGGGNPVTLEFLDTTTNVFQNDGLLDYVVVTGPVPEPASLGMLGVASLLLFRRKRR